MDHGGFTPRFAANAYEKIRHEVVITELPRGYRTINHNGGRYYQNNDVYYQQRGQGYIVVGSPF